MAGIANGSFSWIPNDGTLGNGGSLNGSAGNGIGGIGGIPIGSFSWIPNNGIFGSGGNLKGSGGTGIGGMGGIWSGNLHAVGISPKAPTSSVHPEAPKDHEDHSEAESGLV